MRSTFRLCCTRAKPQTNINTTHQSWVWIFGLAGLSAGVCFAEHVSAMTHESEAPNKYPT
ncbi:hypothetical protein EFS30_06745 [Levilactobacillus parabrevis]|nr:hypothetical protein [Levilactobacillus parabrevis]MCT4490305.1 hypothetical protein [Levilactobacillus parabrevis]